MSWIFFIISSAFWFTPKRESIWAKLRTAEPMLSERRKGFGQMVWIPLFLRFSNRFNSPGASPTPSPSESWNEGIQIYKESVYGRTCTPAGRSWGDCARIEDGRGKDERHTL